MCHAKAVQAARVPVTRVRVKLLLGDEIVFEQQLTVMVRGLACNQLPFLHNIKSLTEGRPLFRLNCPLH